MTFCIQPTKKNVRRTIVGGGRTNNSANTVSPVKHVVKHVVKPDASRNESPTAHSSAFRTGTSSSYSAPSLTIQPKNKMKNRLNIGRTASYQSYSQRKKLVTKIYVENAETVQIPVIENAETFQIPVIENAETIQIPVIENAETVQIPIVENTETV